MTARRSTKAVRLFIYRAEMLSSRPEGLVQVVDWQSDAHVRTVVDLCVRLLGGVKTPTCVAWLPIMEPDAGVTVCRRALVLYADGPTAIVSSTRLPAFRRFLAWSLTLDSSAAESTGFAGRVAREARDVAHALAGVFEPSSS